MHDTLRQIRQCLRLSMNGVVSASMREKGLKYKLNFGVSLPQLKAIARDFPQDAALAETLWEQDVREMKILATLLYPPEAFTHERAEHWAATIPNQEILEQYAMNLLPHISYAKELAAGWTTREEVCFSILGYTLYARLWMKGETIASDEESRLLRHTRTVLEIDTHPAGRAAILMLKHLGRQSPEQAKRILSYFADYRTADSPEKQGCYEELNFEFDYYG